MIWTEQTGIVSIGDLPGGSVDGIAYGVSGDGSIVVGRGTTGVTQTVFIWDGIHGMRELATLLVDDFGLDLGGYQLTNAC